MADDKYTFEQARIRLEEIAAEVRKKDTSLEKSLDLLEEGVRLANICTELVDHTDTSAGVDAPVELADPANAAAVEPEALPEAVEAPDPAPDDATGTVDADAGDDGDGFEDAEEAADQAESVETEE